MKSINTRIFLIMAILFATCITSCEKEPELPPIDTLDPGTIITLEELRNLYQGDSITFDSTYYYNIFAVVTMAEESGNIYREAYIHDGTAAMYLRMENPGELEEGDSIRLNLAGTTLKTFNNNNMLQLDGVVAEENIVKQKQNIHTEPTTTTINDILEGGYQSHLVKLENVQFIESNLGMTIGDAENLTSVNRYIEDCQGRRIIVRTSGYADFASEQIPEGNGSMVAIVGQYFNDWQLYIRHFDEIEMEGERCEPGSNIDFEPNTTIAELKQLYDFSQEFVTINEDIIIEGVVVANDRSGNFYRQIIIQDETAGIEVKINQNDLNVLYPLGQKLYIKAKDLILGSYGGIVQLGGTTYTSGEFLRLGGIESNLADTHIFTVPGGGLPSPVEILPEGNNDEHIYKKVILNNVQFTENQLGNTFAEPNQTTNRTLTDCQGNTIIVRTSSFADFAGFTLPEGNGSITGVLTKFLNDYQLIINEYEDIDLNGERCTVDTGEEGDGTFENPFNVASAINNNSGSGVWTQGYIVGVMETDVDPFEENFNTPFRTATNLMIADSPDETNMGDILIVQLPVGEVRDALNLVSNPERLGSLVKLKGNLTAYFGVPGMRETSDYFIEGETPEPSESIFREDFDNDLGVFTSFNITGQQDWTHETYDGGSAYMNGFAGSPKENEDWLVSPSIDLTNHTNATLQIREAINYLTEYDDLKILVSTNYNNSDPTQSGTWVHLSGFNRPTGNSWTYQDSGDIDISQFDGQNIHIALKYTSTTGGASAWQISRIEVFANE